MTRWTQKDDMALFWCVLIYCLVMLGVIALMVFLVITEADAQTMMPDGRILVRVDTMWIIQQNAWDDSTVQSSQHIDSAFDDSSNWYPVYRGCDSVPVTHPELAPCVRWHRKQCLMVTPEEERLLEALLIRLKVGENIRNAFGKQSPDSAKAGKP